MEKRIVDYLPRTPAEAVCLELLSYMFAASREETRAAILAARMNGWNIRSNAAGYWLSDEAKGARWTDGRRKRRSEQDNRQRSGSGNGKA